MPFAARQQIVEPPHFLDSKVRFSFSKCDTNKWCILKLDKQNLDRFYKTMGKLEQYTWDMLRKVPREDGISLDTSDQNILNLLRARMPGCSTFGHFRVNGSSSNMRIFVGLNGALVNILMIDREGRLQH